MIEIDEKWISLIKKLEKENFRKYEIMEYNDRYYIGAEDLLWCLDDTQDSREHAEEKLKDVVDDYDSRKEENSNSLQLSTAKKLNELINENIELKKELEFIRNTFSEEDYDRLREEGEVYYEKHNS